MSLTILVIALIAVAIVLLVAETMIPSGGVIGITAGLCLLIAVVCAFFIDKWAGIGVLVGMMAVAPFAGNLLFKLWQRTPVGKNVVLQAVTPPVDIQRVSVGEIGRTLSALRPMGEAEFGALTIQVISDSGPLAAGTKVRVVQCTSDGIATVRVADA